MPVYECPSCGRRVVRPEGEYYCKVCGPSVLMRKLGSEGEKVDVCEILELKFKELLNELKSEPERAERRIAETEERIRRYRDKIFDEQGKLIDPEGLRGALMDVWRISWDNAYCFMAQLSIIRDIAREIKCPKAAEMERIHDLEAIPILRDILPEIVEKISKRIEYLKSL